MPWDNIRTQQEEERLPLFSGRNSAYEKPERERQRSKLFPVSLQTSFSPLPALLCKDLQMANMVSIPTLQFSNDMK